jgi:hypothetical protein
MKGRDFLNRLRLTHPESWILIGIPFLFIAGSFFHFLYDLSGKTILAGTISAVNESVWEHAKMLLLPPILWWVLYYLLKGKKYGINPNQWFTGMLVSIVSSILAMMFIYYFYTQAFGVKLLYMDIFILFLAILIGQGLGWHFYRYFSGINAIVSILLVTVIFILFVYWTFSPPHIPLFYDNPNGKYGI